MPKRAPFVLVVEDEFLSAWLTHVAVAQLGYRSAFVGSADHAMALIEKETPVLAFVDLRLQGRMDGGGIAAQLIHRRSKVIICTGASDAEIEACIGNLDIVAVLRKPFTQEEVGQAVRAALGPGSN